MSIAKTVMFHSVPLGSKPQMLTAGSHGQGISKKAPEHTFPPCPGWLLQLYNFTGVLTYAGHTYPFHEGCVSLIPTRHGWRQSYRSRSPLHIYSRFRLPESGTQRQYSMPVICDLAEKAGRFRMQLLASVTHFPENPLWAEVNLWELLFKLADEYGGSEGTSEHWLPRPVRHAYRYIETALHAPISAADVASAVDVSYSHLALLFRKHVGVGIMDHVRMRKMKTAEELICNSNIPIKSVAAQLGYSDLQHFNKLVRNHLGMSPTMLRRKAMKGGDLHLHHGR